MRFAVLQEEGEMGIHVRGLLAGIRLLPALAMALVLAACSSTAPAPAASGAATSGSPIQLKVWIAGTPELDTAMDKILKQFQADNPNVTVTLEDFPLDRKSVV